MKKLCIASVVLLALSLSPVNAAFINGSFESGDFTGWSTIGTTFVGSGVINGVSPTNGTFQANMDNNPGAPAAALNAFFGTTLPSFAGGPTTGSGIQQTVTLLEGSTITFDWSNGGQDPGFDYSFVVINGTTTPLSGGGFTPYAPFSFTAPTAGSYTIGVGVVNTSDTLFTSSFNVDNFDQTDPVPVPPTVFAMMAGGAALGLFRRIRR